MSTIKGEMKSHVTDKQLLEKNIKEVINVFKIVPIQSIDLITDVLRELMFSLVSLKRTNHSINILLDDGKVVSEKCLSILLQYKETYTEKDQYIGIIWEVLSCLINCDVNKSARLFLDYINTEGSIGNELHSFITDALHKGYNDIDNYKHIVSSILTYTIHYTRSNDTRQLILGRVENFIKYAVLFIDIKYDYDLLCRLFTMLGNLLG